MLLKLISFLLVGNLLYATQCSPYFNPEKFYDAPEYLQEILKNTNIAKEKIEFYIEKSELYKFNEYEIAQEI